MVTKSKSIRYSVFIKILCVLLSAATLFGSVWVAVTFLTNIDIYGFDKYIKNSVPAFTSTDSFISEFGDAVWNVNYAAYNNVDTLEKAAEEQRNAIIDSAVNDYLDAKSNLIKAELEYAVNNYDESYYFYEYSADSIQEATTFFNEDVTFPDGYEDAPRNIQVAIMALETCSGRDFLKYETLVREDAFERDYSHTETLTVSDGHEVNILFYTDMTANENQIRKAFLLTYNNFMRQYEEEMDYDVVRAKNRLIDTANVKYYAVSPDDTVFTNLDKIPDFEAIKISNAIYAYYDGTDFFVNGITDKDAVAAIKGNMNSNNKLSLVYLSTDANGIFTEYDIFSILQDTYINKAGTPNALTLIFVCAALFILSVVFMILFLSTCGHKAGIDTVSMAYIDKFPTDLHLILSAAVITAIPLLTIQLVDISLYGKSLRWFLYSDYCPLLAGSILSVLWLVLIEWLASTVRIKKSGNSWFRKTLIANLFFAIVRLFIKIKKIFLYKPKKFMRNTAILTSVYIIVNAVLSILSGLFIYDFGPIPFIFLISFNIGGLVCLLKYVDNLDKIIIASSEHENIDLQNEKLPESLKVLAQNLANSNEAIAKAVEKAVRDEQMKTELITNVSHDLKTPLTSLITYSDLLEKCDIQDESAKKYIGVLHNQSIKLKRLIEDLIEASKVSTGNVTLNKSILNLSELAIQAIVEFQPEMEKNGNEIKFSEPETPPKVFADGSKTYRIISNLLSNAKKYSAPNTRVYVAVYNDDAHGYFEIKNISSEPLNISPEDLTERFVRGDKSRTREGNGLGLSIAKDLCGLQDGELKIMIDGDLFKAIVQLPSKGEIELPKAEENVNIEGVFEDINYFSVVDEANDITE